MLMGFGLAFGRPISKSFGFISLPRRASPPQAYEKIAIYTLLWGNLYINSESRWEMDEVETELHKACFVACTAKCKLLSFIGSLNHVLGPLFGYGNTSNYSINIYMYI